MARLLIAIAARGTYSAVYRETLYALAKRTNASSNACRNRDRSALANGAGPPVTPAPLRKSAMIARVAIAPPML